MLGMHRPAVSRTMRVACGVLSLAGGATATAQRPAEAPLHQPSAAREGAPQGVDSGATPSALGIGFQTSYPVYGLSIKYNAAGGMTVQGILGSFGPVTEYGARIAYRFTDRAQVTPFVFGSAGLLTYQGESAPGFGGGVGVTYSFGGLPGLEFGLDIGFASMSFGSSVDYNYGATSIGFGAHYYIK